MQEFVFKMQSYFYFYDNIEGNPYIDEESYIINNFHDKLGVRVMEKIAIISDIHGNLPALDAVMTDIKKRKINRIFCLGDIAGKGPAPLDAVEEIRNNCEVVLMGNWEYLIAGNQDCDLFKWQKAHLTTEQLDFIKGLPMYHEFYFSGRLTRLCHAAPFSVFHRVQPIAATEDKLTLFTGVEGGECDILGYGDIHRAYKENICGKRIFNAGSVGNPLDITKASYAIIEGEYNSKEYADFSIEIVRIPYDIEKAVKEALSSDMPEIDLYISELRTAIFRGIKDCR